MYLKISYESDFDELMLHLRSKHGKKLFNIEGIGRQTDINDFSRKFFNNNVTTADLSVDSNSNVSTKDIIAYNFEMPKPFNRLNSYYLLWKQLKKDVGILKANQIIESQVIGDFYINDFGEIGKPYCFNFSTYDIALEGLPMIDKIKSIAPKYLYSFKSQIEQFITIASNSTLGATGLADLFIVMAYYVDKIIETGGDSGFVLDPDGWDKSKSVNIWEYVKANIVSLIYTINQPLRGNQSPFTNVSLYDRSFLENMVSSYVFADGKIPEIETIQKLQEIYMEIMNEELERTPITFPITTACFGVNDEGELLDPEFAKIIAKYNKKFGFINIYCGKTSTLSSCCRLRSDIENEYFNVFGAGSSKIGSLGVVTLNMPRLAEKFRHDEDLFFEKLKEKVIDIARINNAKRKIIKKRIKLRSMPIYDLGFMDINKQYSTCGLNGLYEALEIMGYDILEEDGQEMLIDILKVINDTNDSMQKKFKAPHNCEQTPSENSAIKLATKDHMLGFNSKKIDTGYMNGGKSVMKNIQIYNIYSNQFVPLGVKCDMLDRIKLQGKFDSHFSGGAICHVNVDQTIDEKTIVDLIKYCAKQGVIYWAINYCLNSCSNNHMTVGNNLSKCPKCGSKIENTFTRVVGFMVNTKNAHKVRRNEDFPNRVFY
jgi:anaerobic ribonucleoside-triphosphate reductase